MVEKVQHWCKKYPSACIFLICAAVYLPTINFGITGLDDFILIYRLQEYNSRLGHVLTVFTPGTYGPWVSYYRPLFYETIILNALAFGESLRSYHLINILSHACCATLVYRLFNTLKIANIHAFFLALVFGIHPVLCQAVAWIPGRNDVLLGIFVFSFFIYSLRFCESGKKRDLLLSVGMLLLAFFTKEAALLAPVAVMLLHLLWNGRRILDKKLLVQYAGWIPCYASILMVSHTPYKTHMVVAGADLVHNFWRRCILLLQYTGKVALPLHLSVFPNIADTPDKEGIVAVVFLALALALNAKRMNLGRFAAGLLFFAALLLPFLLINEKLISTQTFEHRLYIPITGLLMLIPVICKAILAPPRRITFAIYGAVIAVLIALNWKHQANFRSPEAFWTNAVATAPSSAQACFSLAWQMDDEQKAMALLDKSLQLNPNEKYTDFARAVILQKNGHFGASEALLLREKSHTQYYECDFYLSRAYLQGNLVGPAKQAMFAYIRRNPYFSTQKKQLLLASPTLWSTDEWTTQSLKVLMNAKIKNYYEN